MSEYQYYEFQSIDRPLTQQEMAELRRLSTRATITSTRFVSFYNWGGFRGDPDKLIERYFDAFLYLANWGTRQLMLRLPGRLLDLETATLYCPGDPASVRVAGEHVILDLVSDDEEGGRWVDGEEGEGWMASVIPVRAELAGGDLRCLYIGWLLWVQEGDVDEEALEPPVPAGLGKLSASLRAFADFLRVDGDLLAAAAERSAVLDEADQSPGGLERWVGELPVAEKDALLVRLVGGGEPHLRTELLRRFRETQMKGRPQVEAGVERRTVAEIRAAAERQAEARKRREAAEKARREREAAAARARYLEGLVGREEEIWGQVETLIEAKRAAEYGQAIELLIDLRDLAARKGCAEAFSARIRALRARVPTRYGLLKRLDRARLVA